MCIRDSGRSEEEVAEVIGADWLIYQDLEDLIASAQEGNPEINKFEISIFNGKCPTPISDEYLKDSEASRQNTTKLSREKSN